MIPQITLNNGICVPQLSIGTYKVDDLQSVIRAGFQAGLDAVDAAEHYHNEAEVGQAWRRSAGRAANTTFPRKSGIWITAISAHWKRLRKAFGGCKRSPICC